MHDARCIRYISSFLSIYVLEEQYFQRKQHTTTICSERATRDQRVRHAISQLKFLPFSQISAIIEIFNRSLGHATNSYHRRRGTTWNPGGNHKRSQPSLL